MQQATKIQKLAMDMWRQIQTNLVEVGIRDRKSEFPL
jgi:hypothetical protein